MDLHWPLIGLLVKHVPGIFQMARHIHMNPNFSCIISSVMSGMALLKRANILREGIIRLHYHGRLINTFTSVKHHPLLDLGMISSYLASQKPHFVIAKQLRQYIPQSHNDYCYFLQNSFTIPFKGQRWEIMGHIFSFSLFKSASNIFCSSKHSKQTFLIKIIRQSRFLSRKPPALYVLIEQCTACQRKHLYVQTPHWILIWYVDLLAEYDPVLIIMHFCNPGLIQNLPSVKEHPNHI